MINIIGGRMRYFKWIIFLFVSLMTWGQLQAQDPAGSIRLTTFAISEFYTGMSSTEAGDDDYTWLINYPELNTGNICRQQNFPGGPAWFSLTPIQFVGSGGYLSDQLIISPSTYYPSFIMEGWEDDGPAAQRCAWNLVDQGLCGAEENFTFRYYDYPPGVLNTVPYEFCGDRTDGLLLANFAVNLMFRYTVPMPFAPSVGNTNLICANQNITLSHSTSLNPVHLISDFYKFESVWEYKKAGDPIWSSLGLTLNAFNSSVIEFSPLDFPNLGNIIENTVVDFRVKTRMTVLAGAEAGSVFESGYVGGSNSIQLSPAPPNIVSLEITPSCPGDNTGSLTVTVTGLGEYLYIIRAGENTNPCDPEAGTCGNGPSGRVTSNTFTITNVAKGRHTLIVANKGSTTGVCWNYQFIDVGEIQTLSQNVSSTPASCFDAADGAVTLTAAGGKAVYEYTLMRGVTTLTSTDGQFTGLLADTYSASIKDGCDQLVTQSVIIDQPVKIDATISSTSPSCSNPTNGALTVTTTQGGGRYTYRLLKDNNLITELANATNATWALTDLSSGDYTVTIIDTDHPTCTPFLKTVSLLTPTILALPAENVVVTPVSCYGQNNGSLDLINGEGPGAVVYELTNLSTRTVVSPSPTYKFENLGPGNYQLTKKRNVTGCLDHVDYPTIITITEPQQVSITLTKNDIHCHDEDNGSIISTVVGARPTDSYQWEVNLAGNWVTLPQTTSSLTDLTNGIYRLTLISSSNCTTLSEEVEIIDPAVFSISRVEVIDIKCYGDRGRVVATATGGFVPYTYHYSSIEGTVDVTAEVAELGVGDYTLKITDAGGCEIIHPETISISAPSLPLSFTYALSNFSGYNVPCQGSSGGYIDVLATGGNGGTYSGYRYSIDGITYQAGTRLENLRAGVYSVYVRDQRGCMLTAQVTLTEPAQQMVVQLISKTDVKCYGDLSGALSVSTIGGSTPYTYLLNGTISQNSGVFSNLPSGDYTITSSDKNGCSASYTDTINLLNAPMYLAAQKTDVLCYGQATGTINVVVSGGAYPLHYEWSDQVQDTAKRDHLLSGNYSVLVVDAQGCSQSSLTTINQPDRLVPTSITIPVCVGQGDGEIRMKTEGGVSPFQYSLTNKDNYQSTSIFSSVPAGEYTVYVKDANNCETPYRTAVEVRNDKPEADFIVASKENALDTLVVVEISLPKPDSLEWTFDPSIILLNNDPWWPKIKVAAEGKYPISMKGYFGGCAYSKTLTLTINPYDPDSKQPNGKLNERTIKKISITPNPSDGKFNIAVELNYKQHISVTVFDIQGLAHYKSNWEKVASIAAEIVLPSISPPGIYIVQVATDSEVQQTRIIINR